MDPILWIAVIAFVVAAVFSAVGLGGGLIYMPLLLMLGVSFHRSAALSLAIIAASTLSAAAVYLRARKVSLPMLLLLVLGPLLLLRSLLTHVVRVLLGRMVLLLLLVPVLVLFSMFLLVVLALAYLLLLLLLLLAV